MARHNNDIVVFFIDPTTEKLGEVHSIDGWKKEWFTFGSAGGVPAVKPSLNADGTPIDTSDATKDGSSDPSEQTPLNSQFSSLLDRLNGLETRIASSLATSSSRTPRAAALDTRPHHERIADLRRKMAALAKSMEK